MRNRTRERRAVHGRPDEGNHFNKQVLLPPVEPSQFTSWGFSENIRRYGLLDSMGTVGDCYDNSPMESFWGTMQIELLNRKRWTTVVELSVAMAEFIENFYNPWRRHSSLNYLTPNEFENLQLPTTQITLA